MMDLVVIQNSGLPPNQILHGLVGRSCCFALIQGGAAAPPYRLTQCAAQAFQGLSTALRPAFLQGYFT